MKEWLREFRREHAASSKPAVGKLQPCLGLVVADISGMNFVHAMKRSRHFPGILAIVLAAGCATTPVPLGHELTLDLAALEQAEETRLEAGAVDRGLLAAVIFAETNRVRREAGVEVLRAWGRLDGAAETQAMVGAVFRPPGHTNPFPLMATPLDRVKLTGITPELVAENVALLPIADAPDGVAVRPDPEGNARLVNALTGEAAPSHTYASFARAVVGAWMNSPGHRAQMLDARMRFLSCAVAEARSMENVPMVFCVQVFCTPARQ